MAVVLVLMLKTLPSTMYCPFVTDADVFSGFLPVVFFHSALMTGFCLWSFHRSPVGR